jgi:hypothetical protein
MAKSSLQMIQILLEMTRFSTFEPTNKDKEQL